MRAAPRGRGLRVTVVGTRGSAEARGLGAWLSRVAPSRLRGAVTVAIVSDAAMRVLNRRYRGVDRVTDVLSFPPESDGPPPRAAHLGDIALAAGRARLQARAAGHATATELRVLALHGLLHLAGYDHERDGGRMARAERTLRRKGGLREGLLERGAERRA